MKKIFIVSFDNFPFIGIKLKYELCRFHFHFSLRLNIIRKAACKKKVYTDSITAFGCSVEKTTKRRSAV